MVVIEIGLFIWFLVSLGSVLFIGDRPDDGCPLYKYTCERHPCGGNVTRCCASFVHNPNCNGSFYHWPERYCVPDHAWNTISCYNTSSPYNAPSCTPEPSCRDDYDSTITRLVVSLILAMIVISLFNIILFHNRKCINIQN